MNDYVALALIIVALYLSECVVWARHGAFVITAPLLFAPRLRVLSRLGTSNGSFTLLNPFPPFGHVYVVEPFPFTLHADRVVASRSFSLATEPLPLDSGRVIPWSAVQSARAVDRDVLINDERFAACSTPRHARAAARCITAIASMDAEKERAIEAQLAAHFDVADARARAQKHARWSMPLLIGASGVFVALFLFVPRVVLATGTQHWPLLLASVYSWVALCVVSMYLAHRKLFPAREDRGERWMHTLLMLPAPTMAMRGNDKLGRSLMAGLHPVAVALAVLGGATRDDVVGRALRELKFPRAGRIKSPVDEEVLARVIRLARAEGIDVDAAFAPPKLNADAGQVAWCPRCRAAYRAGATRCTDCAVDLITTT